LLKNFSKSFWRQFKAVQPFTRKKTVFFCIFLLFWLLDIFDVFYESKACKKVWILDIEELDPTRADHFYLITPKELFGEKIKEEKTNMKDHFEKKEPMVVKKAENEPKNQHEEEMDVKNEKNSPDFLRKPVILKWVESEKDCQREIFASQMPADIIEDNELMQNFKKFEEFVKKQQEEDSSSEQSD
jgi:hypothetical protein